MPKYSKDKISIRQILLFAFVFFSLLLINLFLNGIKNFIYFLIYESLNLGIIMIAVLFSIKKSQKNLKLLILGLVCDLVLTVLFFIISIQGVFLLQNKIAIIEVGLLFLIQLITPSGLTGLNIIIASFFFTDIGPNLELLMSGQYYLIMYAIIISFGIIYAISVIKTIKSEKLPELFTYYVAAKKREITPSTTFQDISIVKKRVKSISNPQTESEHLSKPLNSSNKTVFQKVHLGDEFMTPSKKIICPSCNQEIPVSSKICKYCFIDLPKCLICNRSISKTDLIYCPLCNATYHKIEFLEWLKIKASCKSCKGEIDLWEFQKILVKQKVNQQISSKKCGKCKKNIPIDANYCIHCGFEVKD